MSGNEMLETEFYIVIGAKRKRGYGNRLTLQKPESKTAKSGPPATKGNEIAIKVNLSLPESLFKEPSFNAKLIVPESSAVQSPIDIEVINNIESVVSEATGLVLKIESEPSND